MIKFVIMGLMLVSTTAGFAANAERIVSKGGSVYLVPSNSPVKLQKQKDEEEGSTTVIFDGHFVAHGTYKIRYLGPPRPPSKDCERGACRFTQCNICDPAWETSFKPDRGLRFHLPHGEGYPMQDIFFQNAFEFVKAVLTEKTIRRLVDKTINVASGTAAMNVDNFTASIECDQATYSVRFIRISVSGTVRLAHNDGLVEEGC